MKSLRIVSLIVSITLLPGFVHAQNASNASVNASAGVSQATGSVVGGAVSVLAVAASLTVMAVEKAGESIVLVLKDMSTGATVSIKTTAKALGNVSMTAGTVLAVTASAAGYSVYQASRLIAFIPNEIGKSLVHHSKVAK